MLAGERVYPIGWHVDYWNYLGWPDPYSSPAYSARHEHYAVTLGMSSMYTPGMFVQSAEHRLTGVGGLNAVIDLRLEDPVDVSTTLWLESEPTDTPLVVGYTVLDAPDGAQLQVLLVERGLSQSVTAGENAGRVLTHDNSVRAMASASGWDGTVEITPPDDAVRENCSIIGLVQTWSTLQFHGAHAFQLY